MLEFTNNFMIFLYIISYFNNKNRLTFLLVVVISTLNLINQYIEKNTYKSIFAVF